MSINGLGVLERGDDRKRGEGTQTYYVDTGKNSLEIDPRKPDKRLYNGAFSSDKYILYGLDE